MRGKTYSIQKTGSMYFLSLEPPAGGQFFSAVETMMGDWVYRIPHHKAYRKRFQTKEEMQKFLKEQKVVIPWSSGSGSLLEGESGVSSGS